MRDKNFDSINKSRDDTKKRIQILTNYNQDALNIKKVDSLLSYSSQNYNHLVKSTLAALALAKGVKEVHYQEGAPRSLPFRYTKQLVWIIDTKNKNFPICLTSMKKHSFFNFCIRFDGQSPRSDFFEYSEEGNSVKIYLPKKYKECKVLKVYIEAMRYGEYVFYVSFTSKFFVKILGDKKHAEMEKEVVKPFELFSGE